MTAVSTHHQQPQLLPLLLATIRPKQQAVVAAATTTTQIMNRVTRQLSHSNNDDNDHYMSTTKLPAHLAFLSYQGTRTYSTNPTLPPPPTEVTYITTFSLTNPTTSTTQPNNNESLITAAITSSSSLAFKVGPRLENASHNFQHSLDEIVAATPMALLGNYTWSTADASMSSPSSSTSVTTSYAVTTSNTPSTSSTLIPSMDSYLVGMAWSKALVVAIFMLLILVTVVGNTLVILAIVTTRRLRTVTNCFVLNLAITDWLVGTCVMPPAVMVYIVGSWRLGWILCDIWISLDVLLCTASILSLCAISLDRYLAVTQPLTYSKNRRTKRLALLMIFIVWVTALCITCPPYLGWYEPGRRLEGYTVCRYNQNKGYVVFSAMGSFFIPLAVMLYVYLKIGFVLTSRRQRIVRDANSERTADHDIDGENFLSESEHFQCGPQKWSFKSRWTVDNAVTNGGSTTTSKQNSLKCNKCNKNYIDKQGLKHQGSFYELVEISRLSTHIPCTSINCKYGDGACTAATAGTLTCALAEGRAATLPMQQLHCTDSRSSFSETCLAQAMAHVGKYTSNGQDNQQGQMMSNGIQPQQQQQQLNPLQSHHHQSTNQHHHHHHHHHHRIPMRVSTTKRDSKTAKTLTMVMGGFIACWLPFFVYYLLIPFLPPAAVFEGLMSFLTWVGWVNCAINPFIYAFYNPDFRTAFWRLTCKRICRQKSTAAAAAAAANHITIYRG